MKLKYLCLGLLSTLVVVNQAEAMMRMKQAPEMEQKLKEHEHLQGQMLDLGTHGDVEHAAQHIETHLGKHPTKVNRTGKTVNHKIDDLNTRLGTKTAGPTGPSAHEKLTDLMALQGAITNQATARGITSGNIGAGPTDLAGSAIKNEETIIARLKAGIAASAAAGGAITTITATKTTNTAGAAPAQAGDFNSIALVGCNNIEDILAELGW